MLGRRGFGGLGAILSIRDRIYVFRSVDFESYRYFRSPREDEDQELSRQTFTAGKVLHSFVDQSIDSNLVS